MTNRKTTKKALLLSIFSLLICVTMLIGSTFAWFTDTATVGVNTIKSGNLNVELDYWNGTEYSDATEQYLFDNDALWEPGHTEVAYLRIHNAGKLSLKYKLSVNPDTELLGINVAGEEFKLSDYLVFKAIKGKEIASSADLYTRESARTAAGTEKGLKNYTNESLLLTSGEYDYIALVVYMPEDVANEANYKTGTKAPYIDLSVTVVATQAVSEYDSYNNEYDKTAAYPFEVNGTTVYLTQQENGLFKNANDATDTNNYIADQSSVQAFRELVETGAKDENGKKISASNVVLAADVVMDENWEPVGTSTTTGFTGTLDGGGHQVIDMGAINDKNYGNGFFGNLLNGAHIKNMTFENANVRRYDSNTVSGNVYGIVAAYAYGNVTFENITVKDSQVWGFGKVGGILGMAADPSGTTTLINCKVIDTDIAGVYNCGGLIGLAQNKVVMENCEVSGLKWYRPSNYHYVKYDTTVKDAPEIPVNGTYWLYNDTWAYAAWADYYTYYDNSSGDNIIAGTNYKFDAFCRNK